MQRTERRQPSWELRSNTFQGSDHVGEPITEINGKVAASVVYQFHGYALTYANCILLLILQTKLIHDLPTLVNSLVVTYFGYLLGPTLFSSKIKV